MKEAERLADGGSWELIQIARVHYLCGDKVTGQALLDKLLNGKSESSDWFRIARVYAEAGENAKAEASFLRALAEELLSKAFARNSEEIWHYVRAGEALLGVPP